MGRNEPCFCGSNKKQKKCHKNIDPRSEAARMLRLYEDFNIAMAEKLKSGNLQSYCTKGCSECCFDYFTIQSIEFDLIIHEMRNWDEYKINKLIDRVDKVWKKFELLYSDAALLLERHKGYLYNQTINDSIEKTEFPCVFLDESTKECTIYNVRPYKCRKFGSSFEILNQNENTTEIQISTCESSIEKHSPDELQDRMIDVTGFDLEHEMFNVTNNKKRNEVYLQKEYPILYYMYQHFIVKNEYLNIVEENLKFRCTSEHFRQQYYKAFVK